MNVVEIFRKKLETFRKVMDESGEQNAWDALFLGYPERQYKNMSPTILGRSLAAGFGMGIERYKQIGMDMVVVDLSNETTDAVLEVQKTCPALAQGLHRQFGFDRSCHIICDMDIAATEKAFPGIKGAVLCTMADGDAACIFKYERPKKK